jgi:pyruvate/2-oxoglutarate dehydrogenase complex dihydrolipoamide acyltransferase (E2) component
MTITNLGGIGGLAFTPIVNPPEVAILGLTRTEMTPVWNWEAFAPVPMVPLDLSYDQWVDMVTICDRPEALTPDHARALLA